MNIALIIYGSLETVSGGYLYDRKLVDYLRRCGDEVHVISLPWRTYAHHLTQNLSPQLYAHFTNHTYDLILQDELNHPSLWAFNRWFKGRFPHTPLVAIVHHLRSTEQHPRHLLPLYERIERAYLTTVDAFIFNSRTTRTEVETRVAQRPHVIAYPAGSRLDFNLDPAAIQHRAHHDNLRLLFVGNIIARKGVTTLLRAVAQLPFEAWSLTLVGGHTAEPAYVDAAQRLSHSLGITDHLTWMDSITDTELLALYQQSHVFVMPSQYEGFGIVYLEAMGAGLVPVGSTAGAAHEIITHGQTGFLVTPGDHQALAQHITHLHHDRSRLAKIGCLAHERYNQHPTWDDTSRRIRAFLTSLD